jgi:SAM-dependent methyltransferase
MDIVPYEAWVEYVQLILEIAEASPQRVLDCACGTGNVSFELARHGYEVTGVDISAAMIEAAQQKLLELDAPLPVNFICADLAEFDLAEKFDAATCLYDSFNYILDPAKLERAFAQIGKHIHSGGVFVFDMNAPWAFEANLFTQRSRDPRKALHYDWRAQYNPSTRICDVTMQFERRSEDGRIETFSEVHRERAYAQSEVTAMLVQTGWQVLKVYDAYTLNPPHDRSERWYFVARRV